MLLRLGDMSEKIQTRPFQATPENEASWPPRVEIGAIRGGIWHYDREQGKVTEGLPARQSKFCGAPYVCRDEMLDGVKSQTGTGKVHYSKSSLRAEYRRLGVIEVGNDYEHLTAERSQRKLPADYEKQLEKDVGEAIEQVRYNQAPLNEFDKERCKIINQQLKDHPDTRIREDAKKL
jgi:hypothetical protein